jgi:hypothetical protein
MVVVCVVHVLLLVVLPQRYSCMQSLVWQLSSISGYAFHECHEGFKG